MKKLFIIAVIFMLYIATSELSAKKKAEEFCESVSIGQSTNELQTQGVSSGARAKDSNWEKNGNLGRELPVTFTGYYPGSDFICLITEKNGVVVAKNPNIASSLLTK